MYVKSQTEKHCLVKHFPLLKKVCYQCLNFVLRGTYCFITNYWLALNQLSWNLFFFFLISCNLIGQICLRGEGYSSRTSKYYVLHELAFAWNQSFRYRTLCCFSQDAQDILGFPGNKPFVEFQFTYKHKPCTWCLDLAMQERAWYCKISLFNSNAL